MKKSRKTYDRDFKLKAILLSYEKGSVTETSKDLNIERDLLFLWRRDYRKYGTASFPGPRNLRLSFEEKKVYNLEKKIREADLKFEILRNASQYLSLGKPFIFHFMEENEKNYSIRLMCRALGIGRITYRMWKKGHVSERERLKITLKEEICSIFAASKETYGCFRIAAELRKSGRPISHSAVLKCMRELGLYVSLKKDNEAIKNQRPIPNADP